MTWEHIAGVYLCIGFIFCGVILCVALVMTQKAGDIKVAKCQEKLRRLQEKLEAIRRGDWKDEDE